MDPILEMIAEDAAKDQELRGWDAILNECFPYGRLNEGIYYFLQSKKRTLHDSVDREKTWRELLSALEEMTGAVRRATATKRGIEYVQLTAAASKMSYYLDCIKMLQAKCKAGQEQIFEDMIFYFFNEMKKKS